MASSPTKAAREGTVGPMKLVRQIESQIESLLDGVAGRVFRGPLHPTELTAHLVREADFGSRQGDHCVIAPNVFEILVNPSDIGKNDPAPLLSQCQRLVDAASFERGWRLDGPVEIHLSTSAGIGPGSPRCQASFRQGDRAPWAYLTTVEGSNIAISVNHCLVGRAPGADTILSEETVSRRHAVIWREADRCLVADLGSSNGTSVDGNPIGEEQVEIGPGSTVTFGQARYRFDHVDA